MFYLKGYSYSIPTSCDCKQGLLENIIDWCPLITNGGLDEINSVPEHLVEAVQF